MKKKKALPDHIQTLSSPASCSPQGQQLKASGKPHKLGKMAATLPAWSQQLLIQDL